MSCRSMTRRLGIGIALTLVVAWGVPAEAYRMIYNPNVGRVTSGTPVTCSYSGGFAHWTTANIPWRLNTGGQGSGKASAISNALAAWSNVTAADHNLNYVGTTSAGWSTDGTNTALWASGNGCEGGCLALTALVLQFGQVIIESDVTFNSDHSWSTNGTTYDTQSVATHEFGHSLGIHHTNLSSTPRPTMYAYYFGTGARTLEADDRSALQCSQTNYPPTGGGGGLTAPSSLDVQTDWCHGWVTLDWTGSSGASYYELQKSHTSSYLSPDLVYSGGSTSYFGNVVNPSGTTYFRVRACDAGGCSNYRNGNTSAHYYPVCQ